MKHYDSDALILLERSYSSNFHSIKAYHAKSVGLYCEFVPWIRTIGSYRGFVQFKPLASSMDTKPQGLA